jgi:hypothetical protein
MFRQYLELRKITGSIRRPDLAHANRAEEGSNHPLDYRVPPLRADSREVP